MASLNWNSSIANLSSNPKRPTKTILKLISNNILSIEELVWILPLRVMEIPQTKAFNDMKVNSLFKGEGKVLDINLSPAFGKRGKNKIQLFNVTVNIKDLNSGLNLNLKWFNAYPNIKNQLESLTTFTFLGTVQEFQNNLQIINPELNPKEEHNQLLIEYPTINGIAGNQIKSLIRKIPEYIWKIPIQYFSDDLSRALKTSLLNQTFKTLHGLDEYSSNKYKDSISDLIYFEFLKDQLKVTARKIAFKKVKSPNVTINESKLNSFIKSFPYDLTLDQQKVISELVKDFQSGSPMMRIVQGDVGCGKTTIAEVASFMIASQNGQVAIMCPTETLARQHYKSFKKLLSNNFQIDILVGSSKIKDRVVIANNLSSGITNIIIGTHALFQDSVKFSNLQLAIIDEQHKFGVEQRLRLISKGNGTHCLLMSATPIPRTLQLAQYGDLDISTIKTIPEGRKGTQTRIIKKETYEKYLSFIRTRIDIGEQVYVVVPAITESETLDLQNVESLEKIYRKFFPQFKIQSLHGGLKAIQKNQIMESFELGDIDILISTSVIEVGINVLNSTVMSIYNPDRFGLSSLHQLRGRVGRGKKPGFCFLIPDKKASKQALARLKIVESSHDGFVIAEADLKNRGEGDLYGSSQSGNVSSKKIANIFEHFKIFEKVQVDIEKVKKENPDLFIPLIEALLVDKKISTTI